MGWNVCIVLQWEKGHQTYRSLFTDWNKIKFSADRIKTFSIARSTSKRKEKKKFNSDWKS